MTDKNSDAVIVGLSGPGGLFEVQSHNPLEVGFALTSGIERILAEVGARPARRRNFVRLVLMMPEGAWGAGTKAQLAAAIAVYCTARRSDLDRAQRATLREGLQTLGVAAVFIAVLVLIGIVIRAVLVEPTLTQSLLLDGVVIAGWVAFWRPIDLLLFETWLLRRDRRVIDAVAVMPVEIKTVKPESAPSPAGH